MTIPLFPATPYPEGDGTSTGGWSGSSTSRARAVHEAASGLLAWRQSQIIRLLSEARIKGVTWKEVSDALGIHHGSSSGALSNLHKSGKIARLRDQRNKCKIYVLHEYVEGRETETPTPSAARADSVAEFDRGVREGYEAGWLAGHSEGYAEGFRAGQKRS